MFLFRTKQKNRGEKVTFFFLENTKSDFYVFQKKCHFSPLSEVISKMHVFVPNEKKNAK